MNINQSKLSEYKNGIRSHAKVMIFAIILSTAIFLLLLNTFKTYESTVTILVLPKSELAAAEQKSIVANIAKLPQTLSFYDRLLLSNPDVRDIAEGSSQNQRKQIWNDMLRVKNVRGNSSIIRISLSALSAEDSNMLAKKTARNLFDTASFYYNIKTDIDMRIIDGPISTVKFGGWFWLLLLSGISGALLAALFQSFNLMTRRSFDFKSNIISKESIANFSQKIFAGKKTDEAVSEKLDQKQAPAGKEENRDLKIEEEEKTPEQIQYDKEMEALNKIIQQDMYPNFPEMPIKSAHKAGAPDNLPIADDSFFAQFSEPETHSEIKEQPSQTEEIKKDHEPTPEELKDRLNKLLKGEI